MTDEDIILGQILKNNDIYFRAKLRPDNFLDPRAKKTFLAIQSCFKDGADANLQTVVSHGADPSYTATLTSQYVTANWDYYAKAIKKKSAHIRLKQIGRELMEKSGEPDEVMSWLDSQLFELSRETDHERIVGVNETLIGYVNTIEKRYNLKGEFPGITCGIDGLDKKLLGFQKSRLYYIGARPSQGKSALMVTMASNMIKRGVSVGIITIESSCQEILDRLFSLRTGISSELLMTGFIGPSDMEKIQEAAEYFRSRPLFIYDSPNCDIGTLRSRAKRMVSVNHCDILFIDYLQIIEYNDRDTPYREKIAYISKSLKQLAREMDVPIVVCAQLRRDAEERRPILSDFSESSQIEKDADGAILIHHAKDGDAEYSYLCVEKNRDGAKGDVPVYFKRNTYNFLEKK